VERERGLDFQEYLFNPFVAKFDMSVRTRATIIASTEPRDAAQAPALRQPEIDRRQMSPAVRDPLLRDLMSAADPFIVKRGDRKTIIAGYPWFSDWGRDTMISLPGLTLATGHPEIAKASCWLFPMRWIKACCPTGFPTPEKRRSTTRPTPRSGFSKLSARC
jgi:predicted glycogen debranching enzyme